jgi:glycosyltransferase involved in cell wall biosynthesis
MRDDRLRLVYLVSTLRRAGPTSQLLNLLRHLDLVRFDPVIVTLSPEGADSMRADFEALGTRILSLSMSRLRALLNRGWRGDIERLVGAPLGSGCVVHSQGIRGDVISSRHLAGVPRVATARNFPQDDYPLKFGRLPGLWMAHAHLRAFRALPDVVACSATLATLLRAQGIDAAVIPNGVDTAAFRPASPAERAGLRARLGLPPAARIGVSVGALSARKDPGLVVRAARAAADPALALIFLGEGPLEAECRRDAGGDSRIRFGGQVDDVTSYLRAADFFVSASRAEGLPNAVLEAMACGLRVVLTDIGPHRELLQLAPDAGEMVPVGDGRALTAAIVRAAAASGRPPDAGLLEQLGAERMSKSYQDLYLRLSGGGAGR